MSIWGAARIRAGCSIARRFSACRRRVWARLRWAVSKRCCMTSRCSTTRWASPPAIRSLARIVPSRDARTYAGKFGGLTASALYSFRFDGDEMAGQTSRGAEYSAGLNYAAGPLSVGAVYDQVRLGLVPGADAGSKVQRATLGGTYLLGPAKVYAGWRWANQTAPGAHLRSNLMWTGLGYRLRPALTLTGVVYYQDFQGTSADPWSLVASADYTFSKRTDVYLNMAYAITGRTTRAAACPASVYF